MKTGNRNITVAVAFLIVASCILILDVRGDGGEIVCFTYLLLSGFNLLESKKNSSFKIGAAASVFIITGWVYSIISDQITLNGHLFRIGTLVSTWMLVTYFRSTFKKPSELKIPVGTEKGTWQKHYKQVSYIILGKITVVTAVIYFIFTNHQQENLLSRESKSLHAVAIKKMNALELLYSDVLFLSGLQNIRNFEINKKELQKDFSRILEIRKVYDQIRLIDTNGYELIRVNAGPKPQIVDDSDLQYKGDREYFDKSVKLPNNQIYISPITLNEEHGKIEYPEKPVTRISTPVYNSANEKLGLLVINYLTSRLEFFATKSELESAQTSILLFDINGNWLSESGKNPSAHNRKTRLEKIYPDIWKKVQKSNTGKAHINGNYYLFQKVSMDDVIKTESEKSYFKETSGTSGLILIKQISGDAILAIHAETIVPFIIIYLLALLIFAIVANHIYKQRLSENLIDLKFESILNNTHSFIGLLEPDGTLIEANNTAIEFAHSSREELIGLKFWDCSWWQASEKTREDLKQAVQIAAQGQFVRYDVNVLSGSGDQITIDFSLRPVYDENGTLIYLIPEGHDITEKVALQSKLHETNEQFREIKEIARIGTWRVDINEMTAHWDKQIYDIHEVEYGTPIRVEEGINFYREDFRPLPQKSIDDAIKQNSSWDIEAILVTAKGKEVWVRAIGYPVFINETLSELRGTFLDIDSLKKNQIEAQEKSEKIKELNQSLEKKVEERTRELLNVQNELRQQFNLLDSSLIISSTNTEGKIIDVNDTLCSISGYSRDELIGQSHKFLMNPKYTVKFDEIWHRISSGNDWKGEICNKRKDGSEYWVDLYIKPFFTPDGRIEKFVSIRYDITESKLVQQKILEQTKKLELANKKLDVVNKELETFSYSVSHDLKAPLRALQGFSKNLVSKYGDQLDETGVRWLTFIRDNAEQMDRLIREMLDFSRINKKNLKKVDVDMTEMINQQIERFKNEYKKEANITIGNIERVHCDYVMMEVVWQNLVGNAFKYSQKKPVINIEIGSEMRNGNVHFFIKDNGAGFDMRYHDKLFGVFQRLHGNDEFEGSGVGLANVQRIIQKHGGNIEGRGVLGEGATFEFELPNE